MSRFQIFMNRIEFLRMLGVGGVGFLLGANARGQIIDPLTLSELAGNNDEYGYYIALLSTAILGETLHHGRDYQADIDIAYRLCLCRDDKLVGGKRAGLVNLYDPRDRKKYSLSGSVRDGRADLTLLNDGDTLRARGVFDARQGVKAEFEWYGKWRWSSPRWGAALEGTVADGMIDLVRQPRGHPHFVGTYSGAHIEGVISRRGKDLHLNGSIRA